MTVNAGALADQPWGVQEMVRGFRLGFKNLGKERVEFPSTTTPNTQHAQQIVRDTLHVSDYEVLPQCPLHMQVQYRD